MRWAAALLGLAIMVDPALGSKDCYGPNCVGRPRAVNAAVDFVNGMGRVLSSRFQNAGTDVTLGLASLDDTIPPRDIRSGIVNFLGLPAEADALDNAPEADLQVGESNATAPKNDPNPHISAEAKEKRKLTRKNAKAVEDKANVKRRADRDAAEASERKVKGAMPSPPPRDLEVGQQRGKRVRLGTTEFCTEKIDANTLHARLTLSGRDIHGNSMQVDGRTTLNGALHLKGDGDVIKSSVSGKELRATVFVNKKDVKSCGIAVGDEGGFFDHNDGFITYEPLSGKGGLRVSSDFHTTGSIKAEGGVQVGGGGQRTVSTVSQREVRTTVHANTKGVKGGGVAISDAGGFYDFQDGSITYEPLSGADGLKVNSDFSVGKNSDFQNVKIHGNLVVEGNFNFGQGNTGQKAFDAKFAEFHKKHNAVTERVKELELTNAALTDRLERMEAMMQEMLNSKA